MRFSDCSFFFKQKTAYELRISDWRSDVCSSDLPTNQFWHLLGEVIDRPLANMPYDERLAALRDAKVGLWDVIRSAERRTSSDSLIREAEANDLAALVAELPDLRMIAFNRSEEHPSELQSLMRLSYAVYCLTTHNNHTQ